MISRLGVPWGVAYSQPGAEHFTSVGACGGDAEVAAIQVGCCFFLARAVGWVPWDAFSCC